MRLASWNTRALFTSHHSLKGRAVAKMEKYKKLCQQHQLVTAQETHGCSHDFETLCREVPSHVHYLSTIEDRAAGGICISVNAAFLEGHFETQFVQLLNPGRLMKLHACGDGGDLVALIVHLTPGLADTELRQFLKEIKQAMVEDANTLNMILGDLTPRTSRNS